MRLSVPGGTEGVKSAQGCACSCCCVFCFSSVAVLTKVGELGLSCADRTEACVVVTDRILWSVVVCRTSA